ncbi:hypothetical protein BDF14DRAFT_1795470 [Spinellus fusiger]|nr:hypothetical protein BDF14DRAFT_1795470 [Spinellus fusiger]
MEFDLSLSRASSPRLIPHSSPSLHPHSSSYLHSDPMTKETLCRSPRSLQHIFTKSSLESQETDISDSSVDVSLRKQASTSSLRPNPLYHTHHSDFIESSVSPSLSFTLSVPPPPDLDITENNDPLSMLPLEPETLLLFRKWMIGFCSVNFDLEIGQALDFVYPPMELSPEEEKNICFSAFPDSNVFEVGDQVHTIRVRASNSRFAMSGPTANAGFLYGYVFFRQKKDPSIRRGYFQKSIVLLSQHPWIGLFSRLIGILGPAFFDIGKPMLEAACMTMAHWPAPKEGSVIDLPFLGHLLQVELQQPFKPQLLETTPFDMNKMQPDLQIMASLPVRGLYHHFKDILPDLWLLWELMLLAEPIVVFSQDPSVCSEAVVALIDLINPIPYCGDYRPYFTIQDTDFKFFITKNKPASNLILGVTNPYFHTAMEHWPHSVRVGRQQLRKPDGTSTGQCSFVNTPKSTLSTTHGFIQGVSSKRKPVILKDRGLLKVLAEAELRRYPPEWVLNNMLRRHFVDLTEKFLVPLNRYFSTLIPLHNPHSDVKLPRLKPFQTDQFMKSLKEHGPQLPFKSTFKTRTSNTDSTKELYSQFLKCGNFATWLQYRTTEAQIEIEKRCSPTWQRMKTTPPVLTELRSRV